MTETFNIVDKSQSIQSESVVKEFIWFPTTIDERTVLWDTVTYEIVNGNKKRITKEEYLIRKKIIELSKIKIDIDSLKEMNEKIQNKNNISLQDHHKIKTNSDAIASLIYESAKLTHEIETLDLFKSHSKLKSKIARRIFGIFQ